MKRLSLVVLVMIVAAALLRLAVHALWAEPPPNLNLSDPPRSLPEIAFEDGAGARRKLSDFRGKFVLLNIWATWCIPCRKEMPTLDRLQGRLGGPDFEVVACRSIARGRTSSASSTPTLAFEIWPSTSTPRPKRPQRSPLSACRPRCSSTGRAWKSGALSVQPYGIRLK